jgi:CDP-4-dehydro-6-deoxyglucose reductase, E1
LGYGMSSKRESILNLTREFAQEALVSTPFIPGETSIPVSGKVLTPDDFVSLVDSSLDGWFTAGKHTKFLNVNWLTLLAHDPPSL